MSRLAILILLLVVVVAAPALGAATEPTIDEAAAAVQVQDDPLNTNILFILPRIGGPIWTDDRDELRITPSLGAYITKRGGITGFMVGAHFMYRGHWRFYERATYLVGDEPRDVVLRASSRRVVSCDPSPCLHSEVVSFQVPGEVLRAAAESAAPWRIRFRSRQAGTVDIEIRAAEIAGLLQRLDAYPKPRP